MVGAGGTDITSSAPWRIGSAGRVCLIRPWGASRHCIGASRCARGRGRGGVARRRGRGGEGASHRCTRELGPAPALSCGASATARPEGASCRGGTGARSDQRRGHQARGDGGEWEVLARKGDKAQQGQSVEGRWEGGLAGDGVRLSSPVGVAAREDGIIFVADEEAHAVFALQQVRGGGASGARVTREPSARLPGAQRNRAGNF